MENGRDTQPPAVPRPDGTPPPRGAEPVATVVVVPRERFSAARASLESIFEHTTASFELVYVDAGSPRHVARYLAAEAERRGFRLIRINRYLAPNQARNIGARTVTTPYVVFVDNDVIVSPGWLDALIDCAAVTGAAVVGPLTCHGLPLHTNVHCAGGRCRIAEASDNGRRGRHIAESIAGQGRCVDALRPQLRRERTELAEFHCALVETAFLHGIGLLDEGLLSTREHVDLCLLADHHRRAVYFEPSSVVTYLSVTGQLRPSDLPFYLLRWSDAWELASLAHLQAKWSLNDEAYFAGRRRNTGWRRRAAIVKPLTRRVPFPRVRAPLEAVMGRLERAVNRRLADFYWTNRPAR